MTLSAHNNATSYLPGATSVHLCDARVKILLLLAFSISLFVVSDWCTLLVFTAIVMVLAALARLPLLAALRQMVPLLVILGFTLVFNAFAVLDGAVVFSLAGLARGAYYVIRIIVLVVASLVLTTTTTSEQMLIALERLMAPLRALRFPVQDAATVLALALRFIPVTIDGFHRVRRAQEARGARFNSGGLWARCKAWSSVLIPWFVSLYRHAHDVALAMESRCYGFTAPTRLEAGTMGVGSAVALALGLAVCVLLCWISACLSITVI